MSIKYISFLPLSILISNRPRGYRMLFMLNSANHEILNAHKYKKYKEIQLFSDLDKFFLLINVKMQLLAFSHL